MKIPFTKKRFSIFLLLFLVFCLTSCNDSTRQKGGDQGQSQPKHIVYRLKWLFNASVVGDIWAKEKGVFELAGLTVEVKEGGPEQDAIKDLELGRAHFGVASADQVIRAAAKGAPVLVVAQLFQKNPLQWIYRCDQVHINSPQDLKKYRIGVTFGGNDEAILLALLSKYHLDPQNLDLYAVHYDFNPFWKGLVNLWPVYRNTQGILLSHKMAKIGEKACFFDPTRYGIKFVANSVVTSQAIYDQHPELVVRFVKALLKAWADALSEENLENAVALLKRYAPETPKPILEEQIRATRTLVLPDGVAMPGMIDMAAWRQTEQIMVDQQLIDKPVKIERLLKPPLL